MNPIEKFTEGLRVQMWDEDDNEMVYGKVTRVMENSIKVKWDDLREEVEHFDDEFSLIQPSKR